MHIYNKENPHFPSKNKIETSRTVIYYIIPIGTDFTGTDITGTDITDNFSYFVNIFTQIKGRKLV
mgnify:FL=1